MYIPSKLAPYRDVRYRNLIWRVSKQPFQLPWEINLPPRRISGILLAVFTLACIPFILFCYAGVIMGGVVASIIWIVTLLYSIDLIISRESLEICNGRITLQQFGLRGSSRVDEPLSNYLELKFSGGYICYLEHSTHNRNLNLPIYAIPVPIKFWQFPTKKNYWDPMDETLKNIATQLGVATSGTRSISNE